MALLPTKASLDQDAGMSFAKGSLDLAAQAKQLQQGQTGKATTGTGKETVDTGYGDLISKITEQQSKAPTIELQQQQKEAAQSTQTQQANMQLKEKSISAKETIRNQTEDLLQKFEQDKGLLNLDRYKAEVEQIGFGLRMQNDKYVDNLKLEGERSRLKDKGRFQQAMAEAAFSEELDLLKNNLEFRRMSGLSELAAAGRLNDDRRASELRFGEMDIDMALKIAMADSDAQVTGQQYSSIGSMIKIGGEAYGSYRQAKAEQPTSPTPKVTMNTSR